MSYIKDYLDKTQTQRVEENKKYRYVSDITEEKHLKLMKKKYIGMNKIHTSGNPEGAFLLTNGQVIEESISFGWSVKIFVFENETIWRSFNPPAPISAHFEF